MVLGQEHIGAQQELLVQATGNSLVSTRLMLMNPAHLKKPHFIQAAKLPNGDTGAGSLPRPQARKTQPGATATDPQAKEQQ